MSNAKPKHSAQDCVVAIDLTTDNPEMTNYGETSHSERQHVAGMLMQAAQKIGSGSTDLELTDPTGEPTGTITWSPESHTGESLKPPEEPPPEKAAPAPAAAKPASKR
jgi:hypothetical protein